MKIVFFGSPEVSLIPLNNLIEDGHHIPLIITQPDRPRGRGRHLTPCPVKEFAVMNSIPVFQPNRIKTDDDALNRIKEAKPDINIVAAYGQIIPRPIIDLPHYKSLNIHFSLLPKYRGASPVQWALLEGEKVTGVTIFQLNEKMDEGDILSQEKTVIQSDETAIELEKKLAFLGADLLVRTLRNIDNIPLSPQNHSLATHAPLIKKQDGEIDWSYEAIRIERQIRAFTPWPSTYTYLQNARIKILKGNAIEKNCGKHDPGEILSINRQGIEVSCGTDSLFRILVLQPENKKPMDAHAYSLGARLKTGMFFSKEAK